MSEASEKPNVHRILGTVQYEHGFHFNVEKKYTGVTAKSLVDFASLLESIDVASILYHYPRGDFQKWIEDTLGDKELADQMCFIKREISGEQLRNQLLKLVQKRIRELKALGWVEDKGV